MLGILTWSHECAGTALLAGQDKQDPPDAQASIIVKCTSAIAEDSAPAKVPENKDKW